ncbi:BT0820 family HAD-type phosphatase [Draconibacterium sediminis]|uniref:Hydrolase n=1 Tax=Draconibacterium sediminis TaxID=1544798 RepID=A0A0D8JAD5_9BACT|nr:hydrolase [Draconibacterium sediminis]KJF43867.1 hydrolase [Draconibacterium sediminis]
MRPLTIAVDFDGTIVEHQYPKIGNELPFAFETLHALQKKGHKLILWTYRSEIELDEAVEFCREKGLEFYAVNKNYPEEKMNDKISRKILADLYIDDRNYGGMPEWTDIYYSLHPEEKTDNGQPKMKSWRKKIEILQKGIR